MKLRVYRLCLIGVTRRHLFVTVMYFVGVIFRSFVVRLIFKSSKNLQGKFQYIYQSQYRRYIVDMSFKLITMFFFRKKLLLLVKRTYNLE